MREAVESGIEVLDLAPSYGNGEAEPVIGEAFGGTLPAGVRVTTKWRADAGAGLQPFDPFGPPPPPRLSPHPHPITERLHQFYPVSIRGCSIKMN